MTDTDTYDELTGHLREVDPGEHLDLACADHSTRSLDVTACIEKQNGGVTLKADGHGTDYQIDVPPPERSGAIAQVSIRWPSGNTVVREAAGQLEPEAIRSDMTAEDMGIARR